MKKIAIVSGFGIYDKNLRTSEEITGLNEFYEACKKDILNKKPDVVVLSGGYTDERNLFLSESESIFQQFFKDFEIPVLTCAVSNSTSENFVFGALTARKFLQKDCEISFYTDSSRKFKAYHICNSLLKTYEEELLFNFKIIDFERKDTNPKSDLDYQTTTALNNELRSYEFEAVKEYFQQVVHHILEQK